MGLVAVLYTEGIHYWAALSNLRRLFAAPRAKLYPEVPSPISFTPELSGSKDCFESKTCLKICCLLSCNDATPVNNLGPYTSSSEYSTKRASQASSTLLLRVFADPWQFYPILLKNPSSDFLNTGIRRAGAIFVYLLVWQEAPADRRTPTLTSAKTLFPIVGEKITPVDSLYNPIFPHAIPT